MSDFLKSIVAQTRARLAQEPPADRAAAERAARARAPHALRAALSVGAGFSRRTSAGRLKPAATHIIAEIKAASPSAGSIVENPDVEGIAADYKKGGAAAISI